MSNGINKQINLRPPVALRERLEDDAASKSKKLKKPVTVQAVALKIIADHYSIETSAPARGRPKKPAE